jgi:DNA-binding beta-propeller fold protein YncE
VTSFLITDQRSSTITLVDTLAKVAERVFGAPGSGDLEFLRPARICRRPDGGFLVADRGNDRIAAFDDLGGSGWTVFGAGKLSGPTDVAVGADGVIYVADAGNRRIVRVDDLGGGGWTAFGAPGTPSEHDAAVGKFNVPAALAVDSADRLYVADAGAGRVVRVDGIAGDGWTEAGLSADPARALVGPGGVVIQAAGVVVSEFTAGRVATIASFPSGPIGRFDASATGLPLAGPAALAADGPDSFAVCDAVGRLLHLAAGGASVLADVNLRRLGIHTPTGLCPA